MWLRLDENRLKEELANVVQARERMQHGDQQEAGAREVLGSLYALQGRITDAVRAFDSLVKLQPNCPKAIIRRGLILHFSGQPDEGQKAISAALTIDPNDADALELQQSL